MSAEPLEVEDRPAATGSALAGLRDRRDAARKKLHLDLAVPRLDPPVYVRFAPVPQERITRVARQHKDSKARDVEVVVNAVHLASACIGVFGEVDGKPEGDPDSWPRFDAQLAEILGLPADTRPVDIVRDLYLTDGDVLAIGSRLLEWSGYVWQDTERDAAGN